MGYLPKRYIYIYTICRASVDFYLFQIAIAVTDKVGFVKTNDSRIFYSVRYFVKETSAKYSVGIL